MPLELGVWRIDQGLASVEPVALELEARLEDILDQDIKIASPNWMVVGRQVQTSFGKVIDLLALDVEGNLVVLELKRDRTYRDIVAQVLDYGSWVTSLRSDDIARIFGKYRERYRPSEPDTSLDEEFCRHFSVRDMPDELNEAHELVIVASALDVATERVVQYLSEQHGVSINAVFFRVFRDGDREYLTRAWLTEPTAEPADSGDASTSEKVPWNGEYYFSFGGRDWDEAVEYGFVSAGGGTWYTRTLGMLDPGDRIWVNIPGTGYVGVGRVLDAATPVDDFRVDRGGARVPITSLPLKIADATKSADDSEKAEQLVRVNWIKTVREEDAVREKGFFGNQNTVAQPRSAKWDHTVNRLRKRFGVAD